MFEDRYFGELKEALSVPGSSASAGHTLYKTFDGYRVSGTQPDDSIHPGMDGFEAELFAADDDDQFVINLHHRTSLEGEKLHSDFYFAYEGAATGRDHLKEDRVLTWDMLAWGVQGVGTDSTPEYAEIDVFMPHEHPRSDRPLVAVNTANNQALMLHPDGISIGQLSQNSEGQAIVSAKDYSLLSEQLEPTVLVGDYDGAIFGADAQGFSLQGENTLPDGVTEQFSGGGYAVTVEGLSDTAAKSSGGLSLEGDVVSRDGTPGTLTLGVTDRATGEMSATFAGDLAYSFGGRNSDHTAAYISDDFFGMVSTTENTSGYLAAVPFGERSDVMSWGVWDVVDSSATPTVTGGLWVAGIEAAEAAQYIQNTLASSDQTYTYNGRVMGTSSMSGDILMNENNSVKLIFNFSRGMIMSGSEIRFDTRQTAGWSGTGLTGGVDAGTFTGSFSEGGGIEGTFYGSEAQAAGGRFNLMNGEDSAGGVFKAVR